MTRRSHASNIQAYGTTRLDLPAQDCHLLQGLVELRGPDPQGLQGGAVADRQCSFSATSCNNFYSVSVTDATVPSHRGFWVIRSGLNSSEPGSKSLCLTISLIHES